MLRALLVGAALLLAVPVTAGPVGASGAPPVTPQLVAVRAASHPGFDRVVWQFDGGLPEVRQAAYVDRLTEDGSGRAVRIAGAAILQVTMHQADAHDDSGAVTAPRRVVYGLTNVTEVVRSGDFEATVGYGVGLVRRQPFTLFTLTGPSRVVLDVRTDYPTSLRGVRFLDAGNVAQGRQPYTRVVPRTVPATTPAGAVLSHLFAGPTAAEVAAGLAVVRSQATGFRELSITDGIARLRLTGGCSSGGSTITVADLIQPTLKQFASVQYVKIYGPDGTTEQPTGRRDSIPLCLEP